MRGPNENSSASEDENHGIWSPLDTRETPTRVRLNASSAVRFGTRISFKSSVTNRLRSDVESPTTVPGGAEYITSVPRGAVTGARPLENWRKRRSNGLRRDASRIAIFTLAPRLFISLRTESRLTPSRRTSFSSQIAPSTGIMKLCRPDWMP